MTATAAAEGVPEESGERSLRDSMNEPMLSARGILSKIFRNASIIVVVGTIFGKRSLLRVFSIPLEGSKGNSETTIYSGKQEAASKLLCQNQAILKQTVSKNSCQSLF